MKIFTFLGVLCSTFLVMQTAQAQNGWPKTTTTANGTVVKIYEWQPESFSDNKLKARAAISVIQSGKTDPVFGVAWIEATTANSGNQAVVQSIYVTDIKLPGENKDEDLEQMALALEKQAPSWELAFAQSELQASMELDKKQNQLSQQINNAPPKVIYTTSPSILVLIDGTPKLQHNSDWGAEAVVNSPFAIVKNNDGRYYLYGGKHWYSATSVTGSYSLTTNVPGNLNKVAQAVNEANKDNEAQEKDANTIYNIIISTEPAELIQSTGEANFAAVNGTGLLYVSNSNDDIFMDINTQQYYVLISGRWYQSKTLSGNWQYTGADKLPADFAKIPAGSTKDNVLSSVAGTEQADDAVKEAQVPQTAKVNRSNSKADIVYDGDPEFESIDGTDMSYAINTPASVVRWRGRYYAVDDGIWFESNYASGPWAVAVVRPQAIALIPPRYPVYYMKYVYIYDYTPDYVYVGYTPGYLNTYVYGPTVVYGTGYHYRPWYRSYYYPRPCTWGYGVRYNPWFGWGMNVGFSTGWFHVNMGFGNYRPWGGWGNGGWWGPRVYRPPYCYSPYGRGGGWYGGGGGWYGANRGRNINITNINYNNNIYRARRDVTTRDNQRFVRNDRGNNGRQNFANNNNRFNNDNRFRNESGVRRNVGEVRNDLPPGARGDRNRPFRQTNPGVGNNNSDGPNRNGRADGVLQRDRNNANNNNGTRPNRQWRSNDNAIGNGGNTNRPGNAERPPRQFNRPETDNNNNNREPRRQFGQRENSDNNNNREPRRQFGQNDNNNNREPRRIENNNNRQEPIRRVPERVITPQNREQGPARRDVDRPDIRRNDNGGSRQPQIERRESNRPPVRESVRRDDAPRNNGGGQRGGGGNGGGRGGDRPSRGDNGRGGRGN